MPLADGTWCPDYKLDKGNFSTGGIYWEAITLPMHIKNGTQIARFDLTNCVHLKPYSLAAIAASALLSRRRFGDFKLVLPSDTECTAFLDSFGFSSLLGHCETHAPRSTSVPIQQLQQPNGEFASKVIEKWLEEAEYDAPAGVAPLLQNHLDEVLYNVFQHSNSEIGCVVAGQAFPKAGFIDISIVDLGISIPQHLKNANIGNGCTDSKLILMATEEGVTGTQPGRKNLLGQDNSGSGLAQLRSFSEQGHAEMAIISGRSAVHFRKVIGPNSLPHTHTVFGGFPGCLVNLRFDLNSFGDFADNYLTNDGCRDIL
ncbi:MAG: hypothetical protein ACTS3F_01590 [Phycisphaerales bacterium]